MTNPREDFRREMEVKAHLDDDVVEPYYLVINDHTTLYECSRCGAAVPYRAMNRHDASHPIIPTGM